MKFLPSKRELIKLNALNQIATLVNLRHFLTNLRSNAYAPRNVITDMESFLDLTILSLTMDGNSYDSATRQLMDDELKRMRVYRNETHENIGVYLVDYDEQTRTRVLETRSQVDNILKVNSSPSLDSLD
jgi:hypothetical protein